MRVNCLALSVFVFLAASQCQEYNNIESPLGVTFKLKNDVICNESVQFGSGIMEAAKLETFIMDIINSGKEPIKGIEAFAFIPKGIKYINSSYLGNSNLEESREPNEFDQTQNTIVKWDIGDLQANEKKSILIRMHLKCDIKEARIEFSALGETSGRFEYATGTWSGFLSECNCTSMITNTTEAPLKINLLSASSNTAPCAEWIVFSNGKMEAARLETFIIDVQNVGEYPISDFEVLANIPPGMKYASSSYSEMNQGKLNAIIEPKEFDEAKNTIIAWNIGGMHANEYKSILLNTYLKCHVNKTDIELAALGNAAGKPIYINKNISIKLRDCTCTDGFIDISVELWELNDSAIADLNIGCFRPVFYNISAKNNGEISLTNVKVIAEMTKGMMFVNSSYSDSWRGTLNCVQIPDAFDENIKTKLVWSIGDLLPRERKSIILAAFILDNSVDKDIFSMVQGYSPFSPENEPIIIFRDTVFNACAYKYIDNLGSECSEGDIYLDLTKKTNLCKKTEICSEWTRNVDLAVLMQSPEAEIAAKNCIDITKKSEISENTSTGEINPANNSELDIFNNSELDIFNNSELDIFNNSELDIFNNSELDIFNNSELDIFNNSELDIFNNSELDIFNNSELDIFNNSELDIFNVTASNNRS